MNDVKITSNNQSGGITGQNINTGNDAVFSVAHSQEKDSKAKTLFWWIFGITGAVASVIAIANYVI